MHKILLLSLVLTGCAATISPMTTPDGRKGFSVSCNGSGEDWSSCYNAAIEACGGKYEIIDRQTSTTPTAYGPMVYRYMIVGCKG